MKSQRGAEQLAHLRKDQCCRIMWSPKWIKSAAGLDWDPDCDTHH